MRQLLLLPLLALAACQPSSVPTEADVGLLYVGTYTKKEAHVDGKAEGIYRYAVERETLQGQAATTGIINPSYLAIDSENALLYAVSEIGPDVDSSGQVAAYQIKKDGSLQELNRQPTFGFAPCYVSLHPDGSAVFVANYVGGTVAVYPRRANGELGEASQTWTYEGQGPHPEQEAAHPHCIIPSPDGRYVYVADKGSDRVAGFRWNADGQVMEPLEPPFTKVQSGAGPRHLCFHPTQSYLYLINELNSTVDVFAWQPDSGLLTPLQSITTLPEGYEGTNACADIHLSPDGAFLYASNRGHNSLAIYKVGAGGRLSPKGFTPTGGAFPRNFMITPDGQWLYAANQNSDNIVVFKRDSADGSLTRTKAHECPTPVCLKMYTP
ncbi:MAG: beta-propeller fold lactonase family protein [Bacteroidetes bacterium]|jgi:6-phosphogluconolactonase|nr:beta-propeller fold lactonase family protein [Bacteroidota bacterium]